MNSSKLIFIDWLAGLITLPIIFIFKFINLFKRKNNNNNNILIIKFLGAGNFFAIEEFLRAHNCVVITSNTNKDALNFIRYNNKDIFIKTDNIFILGYSSISSIFKLLKMKFDHIINMESESSFAKLVSCIPYSNTVSAISNRNKSPIDYLLFNNYIVAPILSNKNTIINNLYNYKPMVNDLMEMITINQKIKFINNTDLQIINKIIIAPTCSSTDSLRRVEIRIWKKIIETLLRRGGFSIDILFPDTNDIQYDDFLLISKESKLNLITTNYNEFCDKIKKCDLVISVDSQALHLAQHFNIPIICFYGPTSPYGVRITDAVYPITKSLNCSPCTHKYLKLPCDQKVYCMNFTDEEILHSIKFIS
ncbi:glycosyltransferase family 9 protein [Polynucleobacter sp. Nonnen-W13]|uniref:glycosyltransferase family 9 protein n=1 Tax=Polynucleobacter sp. Nonnen-W13 TaxID=1855625 RepID=UPI001C0B9A59|nr:glycosyltransferase family 9 protein [Polynucleobacter sp. Nonnen-W13]MBU3558366.1 hypothetical protein [Polynucleobacter sp. Nonnen-W13]